MGRLKQLLPWAGTTLIAWQVEQLREAGADDIVVVLGHEADQVRSAVPATARIVLNESYLQGRASSLRCGAEAVSDATDAILILSVDQPRPAWLSRLLIDRWRQTRAPIVSPRFPRRFGHPVLVAGALLPELRAVTEETLGLRAVIDRHLAEADAIPVANEEVDVDLNTPSDYGAALGSFQRGEWRIEPNHSS
jgi:molybdenum cofactor cytidylyltransferase